MRRRFSLVLGTTFTSMLAVPLVVALPTLSAPTADPRPVEASVQSLPLTGVDRAADPEQDGAAEAEEEAQRTEAEAAGGLAPALPEDTDADPDLHVLTAQRGTREFSSVAVSWDLPSGEPPALTVLVRTHSSDGWSDWQALDPIADSTDPTVTTVQRTGTGALWVGESDGVQARVDLISGTAPTGIKLELIDPGTSAADSGIGSVPAGSAAAAAGQPQIYSRASWGADESRVRANPTYMSTIQAGVLHHTTDTNSYSSSQVPAMIRADYAYHLSLGWNDIGYNFLVDRFGRIWEGRRGGIAAAVMGAHAGGFNTNTFGVAAIGNLETARPTSAMISGITRLFAWKLDINYRDPLGRAVLTAGSFSGSRYPAGQQVSLPVIMGHRDADYTACPGKYLYPYLSQIRSGVASVMKAEIANPRLSNSMGSMGQSVSVVAGTVTAQNWTMRVQDCSGRTVATAATGRTSTRAAITGTWNGKVGSGLARPGPYTIRMDSSSSTGSARAWTADYLVKPPPVADPPTGTATSGEGGFVPITPTRLLDTRSGSTLPLGTGGRVDVPVLGRGGIPQAGTTAVVLNVTAFCPSHSTWVRVWPTGTTPPATSNINTPSRSYRTTTVVTAVGADGKISLAGGYGVTNLVVDVVGYLSTSSSARYLPIDNTRVFRDDLNWAARTVSLPTLGGVPGSQVEAVVATVTVVDPAQAGFVQVRSGSGMATVMNYAQGQTESSQVVIPAGSGRIQILNGGGTAEVVVDVAGIWTRNSSASQQVSAVSPVRALDTTVAAGVETSVTVRGGSTGVPTTAKSVLVNLTVVGGPTYLTSWATGTSRPIRAEVYSGDGDIHPGMSWVAIGSNGKISVWSRSGSHRVVVDILGYTV